MNVHRTLGNEYSGRPDGVQNLIPRKDASRGQHQKAEDPHIERGQMDCASAPSDTMCHPIKLDIPKAKRRIQCSTDLREMIGLWKAFFRRDKIAHDILHVARVVIVSAQKAKNFTYPYLEFILLWKGNAAFAFGVLRSFMYSCQKMPVLLDAQRLNDLAAKLKRVAVLMG